MNTAFDVEKQETSALSSDERSWLRVVVWRSSAALASRGAVQLVHGMAEHIDRYDAFARYLAGLGYVVFGHDHIGHGKSVTDESELGHMPINGGKDVLLGDVRRVREAVASQVPGIEALPQFIFGHSMGSFITRAYVSRWGDGLAGAVLCGTGNQARALSLAGRTLARLIGAVRGPEYRSRLLDSMGVGAFAKAIPDARTNCDWICTDPAVVDDYLADPLSGQMFSVGGYATLTDLTAEVVTPASAAGVPKSLPLLFIAGEEDPVGECGTAVQAAAKLYRDAGVENVHVILYPGMRHEILNEPDHERVFADVEQWFTERSIGV